MTVYVTQDPPSGISILKAKEYGELVVLVKQGVSMFETSRLVTSLHEKLCNFSDNDYILPMGDPAVIGIVTAIAGGYNNGRIKFVKWDRLDKQYFVWTVQL